MASLSNAQDFKNFNLDGDSFIVTEPLANNFSQSSQEGNSIRSFARDGVTHSFLGSHLSYANTLETLLVFSKDGPLILTTKEDLVDQFPLELKMVFNGNPPPRIAFFATS